MVVVVDLGNEQTVYVEIHTYLIHENYTLSRVIFPLLFSYIPPLFWIERFEAVINRAS